MKITFKYTIASLAFAAAALSSGLSLSAQNLPTGVYLEQDGICYRKTATQDPNDPTKYIIDLEAFVKGEVTYSEVVDSCDIVLVLDVSGSMDDRIPNYVYSQASVSSITASNVGNYYWWIINQSQSTNYFYQYGDGDNTGYYQVSVGRSGDFWSGYRFFLFFDVEGTRYHINTNGEVVTTQPTNVTSDNTNLLNSNVTLYTRTTQGQGTRKIDALKTAVKAFIEEVETNALKDKKGQTRPKPLNNQIAIVKFASNSYYASNDTASVEVGTGNQKGNHTFQSGQNTYNYTEVVRGLKSVLTDKQDLIDAVDALREGGATAADYGMHLAENIIKKIPSSRSSSKTVVFFTDGEPTHGNSYDGTVANTAIDNSHNIKTITYGTGENATHPNVFSVGVFDNNVNTNTPNFMRYISSNYPNATSMQNPGSKASDNFYKDASGGAADLTEIFKAIASSASVPGSTIGTSSSVTVDVVSSSFSVPANAEDAHLEVLVAKCTGKTQIDYPTGTTKEYLTFGPAMLPDSAGLDPITATINSSNNTVSTTGFDFSKWFCGPDNSTTPVSYRGYKQIIRFTITVADDAVGGPDVATNDSKSGIYVDGRQIAEFNRPRVKLPVQIWIQKIGLVGDDSAVFTLYSSPFEGFDKENLENNVWTAHRKFIVNKENLVTITDDEGNEVKVVKLVGLDPDYYYKLKEDAWAFGYQYQADGIVYTVGDNIQNPFKIVNKSKDVQFDEAVVRNVFKERKATTPANNQ